MGYIELETGLPFNDSSYTVRGFPVLIENNIITKADVQYHGTAYMGTLDPGEVGYVRNRSGESWVGLPGATQAFLSGADSPNIDGYVEAAFRQERVVGSGTPGLDELTQIGIGELQNAASPVSTNADGQYINGAVAAIGTAVRNLESAYEEDLTVGFMASGTNYIEMPIWSLPGSSNPVYLNLGSSSITFSSSFTYGSAETVTIPFNSPALENSIGTASGTSDYLWKLNLNKLTDGSIGSGTVDLANMKRVKITLTSNSGVGTSTFDFKTGPMKVVSSNYNHYKSNVDTKAGILRMERWPGLFQTELPPIVQNGLTAKDLVYVAKFYVGSNLPTPTSLPANTSTTIVQQDESVVVEILNNHQLGLFTRVHPERAYQPGLYLSAKVFIDVEKVELAFFEGSEKKANFYKYGTIPTGEYFLIFDCRGDSINAAIWSANNNSIDTLFLETGSQPISDSWLNGNGNSIDGYESGYGYAGYHFVPYNGDFYLDYIYSKDVVLAEYESKTFESNLPVEGVNFFPTGMVGAELFKTGQDGFEKVLNTDNLLRGNNQVGDLNEDVTVTTDTKVVFESASTIRVTKTPNAYIGSIQYSPYITAPNFSNLTFKAKLRFETPLQDTSGQDELRFQIILWDKERRKIVYLQKIDGVVAGKWNDIEIPIIADTIYADDFIFEIGHFGDITETGSFWIENPSLTVQAVRWEVSNNDGLTYVPVLNAISDQYKSVNFPSDSLYAVVTREEPILFYTFDNFEDIKQVVPSTGKLISNQYPVETNNGVIQTSGSSSDFAYPLYMPQTIATTSGTVPYNIPACVKSQSRDHFAALYGNTSNITCSNIVDFLDTEMTYSVWFYASGNNYNINLGSDINGVSTSWNLDLISSNNSSSGKPQIDIGIGLINHYHSVVDLDSSWADGSWHQVTFSYDANNLKTYWDGQLVKDIKTINAGTADMSATHNLVINGPDITQTVVPQEDDANKITAIDTTSRFVWINAVILYNKALNQKQIQQQYYSTISDYKKLRVRAQALTKNAWISNYELIPRYAHLGRISQPNTGLFFDQAIFGVSKFGLD